MLTEAESYEAVCRAHVWRIPERFNMGVAVCDRHAADSPDAPALIRESGNGLQTTSFGDLRCLTNRLANLYHGLGLERGDRVAILLSQSVETAAAHIAAWKAGLISIPLFALFGEDALAFRFQNSGCRVVVTDAENLERVLAVRATCPEIDYVLVVDPVSEGGGVLDLWRALEQASDTFSPIDTHADDPALIIYTSGTTGNPKGALLAHRSLLGHLPGIEMPHEFFPKARDRMWTPADWAWIGGLMNVLMGSLYHAVPVLAHRMRKFDPEEALSFMARHGVRNTFMPPTALRLMSAVNDIPSRFDLRLRTVAVAGEPMGAELYDWGRENLGVEFNEFYGQTECNLVVSNCAKLMAVKPGSMGRPAPGHRVAVIDASGLECAPGEIGRIAVHRPDPVMMLEYWRNAQATEGKFEGDWLITGDQGHMDEEGYLWFLSRDDDVITSAGYRIGPGEIEDCLCRHPAVAVAAVIGVPDKLRTEVIKAFIMVKESEVADQALEEDLRAFVKGRLSPHEYPREIEFVDQLPMTATGKIRRKDLRDAEIERVLNRTATAS
ncbi:MAG: AMP-binding protein [Magnetovibrionaceae bacterium]